MQMMPCLFCARATCDPPLSFGHFPQREETSTFWVLEFKIVFILLFTFEFSRATCKPPLSFGHFPQREETSTFWVLEFGDCFSFHFFSSWILSCYVWSPFVLRTFPPRGGNKHILSFGVWWLFFISLFLFLNSLVLRVIPHCPSDISTKGRKQAHSEFWSLKIVFLLLFTSWILSCYV
jgi:hypothetical protein